MPWERIRNLTSIIHKDLDDWYTLSQQNSMSEEEYVEALNDLWSNYCVSEAYEPGSTVKPITVSSALDCGAVTADSYFYCDGGEFITDTQINCDAIYGHGDESLGDTLKNSCNDAMMQIGFKMGGATFREYQSLFNFGKLTGIDLPNENAGSIHTEETMNEVELATDTFGQGFNLQYDSGGHSLQRCSKRGILLPAPCSQPDSGRGRKSGPEHGRPTFKAAHIHRGV